MKKLAFGILLAVLFTITGCTQQETSLNNTKVTDNPIDSKSNIEASVKPAKKSAAEILSDLANQEFLMHEDQIGDLHYDSIVTFAKAFINLYAGAVAEQETVSFENYISNENLLKFTNKMLELEQRQELKGGIGVIFGLENEFMEAEIMKLDEDHFYLTLPFSNQGSGRICKLIVQSENESLRIVDFYFGSKDGIDTIATGHPAVRKLGNPKLWDDQEWVNDVFEELKKHEAELNS